MSQGVTTTVDMSQIHLSPGTHGRHNRGTAQESGRRCHMGYGAGGQNAAARNPTELGRLQKQYFSSKDQLVTLAFNCGVTPDNSGLAKSMGLPTVTHRLRERAVQPERAGND